ncbi:unnamed protein product [Arctia plantaginis]|uniref:Kazal-like domain-containing protein n=1 Tax=Arctia plantaginis TaxID=874455 RepID=A0A8S0ZKF6_ARCPL|nr:unnamed protein product [Arctia plantaginis]
MAFKIALLVISAQICVTLTAAACACTRESRQVCGSDGVTYSNPCLLRCAATESGKEIKIVKMMPCDEPPSSCICTDDLSPVCGTDGQTYNNECIMNCEGSKNNKSLRVKHRGPCGSLQKHDCVCTFIYSPVCGSDGRTYGNKCELNCTMKSKPGLRFHHEGRCTGRVNV